MQHTHLDTAMAPGVAVAAKQLGARATAFHTRARVEVAGTLGRLWQHLCRCISNPPCGWEARCACMMLMAISSVISLAHGQKFDDPGSLVLPT